MSLGKLFPILLITCVLVTCSREFAIDEIQLGSSIGGKGHISEDSLEFRFRYSGKNSFRDLCNYIYFEGDTVCFSADFSDDIDGEINAVFINPSNGVSYPAERVEKIRSRIYGFSLVGSLLESFNRIKLDDPVPSGNVIKIPFILRVEGVSRGRKVKGETKGECVVRF